MECDYTALLDRGWFISQTLGAFAEKAMAAHSSTLAWKIPWMEEPGGCHLWSCTELDMTEVTQQQQLAFFTLFVQETFFPSLDILEILVDQVKIYAYIYFQALYFFH